MAIERTYTQARADFANLCDAAADDREVVYIRRRNGGDVALIAADELAALCEAVYLIRSPRNAHRLLTALARARLEKPESPSLAELTEELGLD